MWVLETVAVAFGMYSALPVPRVEWNEKNMRYALLAFPLVGAVLGLAWCGAAALCAALGLPDVLRGAALCALPVVVTGGIHLDGYADTCDALASHASPVRKQEILRDPHCGAFAVIRLCVYFVAYFALCSAVTPTDAALWSVGLGFVLSRALSGLLLTLLSVADGSSLAKAFVSAADKRRARALLGIVTLLLAAALAPRSVAAVCAAALVVWRYVRVAKQEFGGTSGDLAGWFLVKAEFWMLAAIVAQQYVEKLI